MNTRSTAPLATSGVSDRRLQRPTLAEQLDPDHSHSLVSKEGGLVGKLNLAMQVLHATKTIPEPIPLAAIQQAVDPQSLKRFMAARKSN
jgi:NitT/TauT family transport system substrate-binding protein